MNINIKWLCLASGILLLLGIPTGWPYSYYIFLRWAVFIISAIVAYYFYKSKLPIWSFVFGAIFILFNPIAPIYVSKSTWIPIDFTCAILYFVAGYLYKSDTNKS
jgi:uncharacterized membrane protein